MMLNNTTVLTTMSTTTMLNNSLNLSNTTAFTIFGSTLPTIPAHLFNSSLISALQSVSTAIIGGTVAGSLICCVCALTIIGCCCKSVFSLITSFITGIIGCFLPVA